MINVVFDKTILNWGIVVVMFIIVSFILMDKIMPYIERLKSGKNKEDKKKNKTKGLFYRY